MGDDEEHKEEKKDEAGKHLDESFPVILQTIWDFSSIDIEGTVRRVCNKLLKDSSVPWQIRFRRAVALRRGAPQRAQREGPAVGHKVTEHRLHARALESAANAGPFQGDHAGKLHRSGLVSAVDTMKLAELGQLCC